MTRVLLLMNPKSRKAATQIEFVKEWLQKNNFQVLNSVEDLKNNCNQVIEKYQQEAEIVIVGGGDGSVNEALPGLLKTKLPLAVIPLGTANNLARTLEIPTDVEKALEVLKQGHRKKIDVGFANEIPFLNVVGLGLSTAINKMVSKQLKKILGVFAFMISGVQVIRRMRPFHVNITCDGKTSRAKTWQITVCNGRHYGSGLVIHEDASLTDNQLDCLSTEVEKWWHGIALIPAFWRGRYDHTQDLNLVSGKSLKIETKRALSVDIDGDIKTKTPVSFRISPLALEVFAPEITLQDSPRNR